MSDFKKKIGSAYLFLGGKKFLAILLLCLIASLGIKGTIGFYADKEQSLNNQFIAGMIDLKVGDSFAKLNGADKAGWDLTDLTFEKFLDFVNLKAGDNGSDKIDLSVQSNPSWLCGQIKLTANDENTTQEPEFKEGDDLDNSADLFDGELAQNLSFVAFADNNNDNLPQTSEIILQGKASDISASGTAVALADANKNVWDITGPVFAGNTKSIKKIWCLGTFNADFTCNGLDVSNKVQSDLVKADIAFYAVQQRNNLNFICNNFDTPSTSTTSTGSQYVICSSVTWQCRATQKFASREACRAANQTECYDSLSQCSPNCNNDHPQPRRYFSCNLASEGCSQTALYETSRQCELATNGVCYESVEACTAVCQVPKYQYYTCNTTAQTCSQTPAYKTQQECQLQTGKICYLTSEACNTVCQPPKYYFYNCADPAANSCTRTTQQYTSKQACELASAGNPCYANETDCKAVCQIPKQRFYACNEATYTCDQTALYTTPAQCFEATGKTCYETAQSCAPFCQKPVVPFYYCNRQNPAAPVCALAGNFTDIAQCVEQTHLPCVPDMQACTAMCQVPQYSYYTCDTANYTCAQTSQTYTSALACQAATGKTCYAAQADCVGACQRPSYKYYYCDDTDFGNYTCKQTYTQYFSKALCELGTGFKCFETQADCTTACQRPAVKWQTCDTDCYTCSETANSYQTRSQCELATGKKCYDTSANCAYFCKQTYTYTEYNGWYPGYGKYGAQARWGNAGAGYPNELRLFKNGYEATGRDYAWVCSAYHPYSFILTHDGNGTLTFKWLDYTGPGATLTTYNVPHTATQIIFALDAPDCGGVSVDFKTYRKLNCDESKIINVNQTFTASCAYPSNQVGYCISKYITYSGFDLTKPFEITGTMRWWFVNGQSHIREDVPSMRVLFN